MEKRYENLFEEITNYPLQDTYNRDNMIIEDEKDGETSGICNPDKQTGRG